MRRPMIMVAPNGARHGKADHPALPVTIAETVDTARACHAAGAQALHLHVRDGAGAHSLDAGLYREAIRELSEVVPGIRVQITTEAAGRYAVAEQLACLEQVQPGWASIALREIARDMDLAPRIYATCAEQGTEVQHILFGAGDIRTFAEWRTRGVIGVGQDRVLLVLGDYARRTGAAPEDLAPLLAALPPVSRWMVCAFGPGEHACLLEAAVSGGDCRVGFENGLCDSRNRPWPDNAASVAALRAALKEP